MESVSRVEAAAKAAHVSKLTGVQWDDMPKWKRIDRLDEARATLAAADAVMFSDEAVDLIARTLFEEGGRDWDIQSSGVKSRWLKRGRMVVSALKGSGDE